MIYDIIITGSGFAFMCICSDSVTSTTAQVSTSPLLCFAAKGALTPSPNAPGVDLSEKLEHLGQ